MSDKELDEHPHRCVVHIGFAGSRMLYNNDELGENDRVTDADAFEDALVDLLIDQLQQFSTSHLSAKQYLCAISQLAIGGDEVFTRACQKMEIVQRIFLPQHWDAYLEAASPESSTPDFPPAKQDQIKDLRKSEHIIQERVVSEADNRSDRFEDTNLEILRASDVVVCLFRHDILPKPARGGTLELMTLAVAREKPVLKLIVGVENGLPILNETIWINAQKLNSLPEISPQIPRYNKTEMVIATRQLAKEYSMQFTVLASIIVCCHLLATMLATAVILISKSSTSETLHHNYVITGIFLGFELVLLISGLAIHNRLHHSKVTREWAVNRLTRETLRCFNALRFVHNQLQFVLEHPFPDFFKSYLRTLKNQQFKLTKQHPKKPWEELRSEYIKERFSDPESGQMNYFEKRIRIETRYLKWSSWAFYTLTAAAILATTIKFIKPILAIKLDPFMIGSLGFGAVVLPTLAVGSLSWIAAKDFEARVNTYRNTLAFIQKKYDEITKAQGAREFNKLVLETESYLLGEVVTWYNRRAYLGVS